MSAPRWQLIGAPDDGRVRVQARAWNEPPSALLPGVAGFTGAMRPPPPAWLLGLPGRPWSAEGASAWAGDVVNLLADADVLPAALHEADALVRHWGVRCLNHPAAVLDSTRDRVAAKLAGIAGLRVPRTVRCTASRLADLRAAAQQAGLGYPLLVRRAGGQASSDLVRVDAPDDWEAALALPLDGRALYLIEFVDFADADGRWRQCRIAIVGDRALPVSWTEGDDWWATDTSLVSQAAGPGGAARGRMDEGATPDGIREGAASGRMANAAADALAKAHAASPASVRFRAEFAERWAPVVALVLAEITRRMALDIFAIDASLRPDGTVLLFEANASNPTRGDLRAVPELAQAVAARVANPASWWCPPGGVAAP